MALRTHGAMRAACLLVAALMALVAGPLHAAQAKPLPVRVTTHPAAWTPRVLDGDVRTFARSGHRMYAGGVIRSVTTAAHPHRVHRRHNVMAFDTRTGHLAAFRPVVDGPVFGLLPTPSGRMLYLCGAFRHVNGVARLGLAKLDLTRRKVMRFDAHLDGRCTDLDFVRGHLVVAGRFSTVRGVTRTGLAALGRHTGAPKAYLQLGISGILRTGQSGRTRVYRFDHSTSVLVAVGNFTTVSGRHREQAFMLRLRRHRATLAAWNPPILRLPPVRLPARIPAYLRDVCFGPGGEHFSLAATGFAQERSVRDSVSRWSAAPRRADAAPDWVNSTGGDSLYSCIDTGRHVYVAGHERWANNPLGHDYPGPGAVFRPGIGSINAASGRADDWNPTRSRNVGAQAMLLNRRGLWIGSDGDYLARRSHPGIGLLTAP